LKIGIIVEKFPSHSETFILNKVEGLCRRGHHVTVFRNSKHSDVLLEKAARLENFTNLKLVNISVERNPMKVLKLALDSPTEMFKSLNKAASTKQGVLTLVRSSFFKKNICDLYHFEFSGLALSYMDLIKILPGKKVISCRGSAEKVKPITQPDRKQLLKGLFDEVDAIHCVSDDMSETVQALSADEKKIFVNRPSIKSGFFQRQKRYPNDTNLTILSIGRLTFQKGYIVGLLAIKELIKSYPNISWKIVGDGHSMEELTFYINDLQLQDHVQLLGAKTTAEIFELYNSADIFFLPSVYEGIANVVLEAMSMELPVVSSDCSGMKEVIQHNMNGLLATNYDHAQMADCLLKLCTDYTKRRRLGVSARKTIVENFDIEQQLDVFEYNYQQLLQT
jgi:colanic acid/amylovoran biosynthesis glycosyltransferase